MRPLVIAVLLLSCAGDEARRSSATATAEPAAAPPPVQPAPTIESAAAPEHAAAPAPAAEPAPPPDPRAATRLAAHDALAANCGECHEGHRSNAPKALAIFDLDLPDWPTRFNEHRFGSALRRLQQKSDAAAAAFIAFRDAERATASAAPP